MLPPLPRRSVWAYRLLSHPAVSAFPERVVGSACASSFSRLARRSLALRPAHSRCHQFVTRFPKASATSSPRNGGARGGCNDESPPKRIVVAHMSPHLAGRFSKSRTTLLEFRTGSVLSDYRGAKTRQSAYGPTRSEESATPARPFRVAAKQLSPTDPRCAKCASCCALSSTGPTPVPECA